MGKSLKDQFLKLGLVDKKKVNNLKKEQHQSKKKAKKGTKHQVVDENVLLARKAEEKKRKRAQELNKEREAKLQKRAEDARIKQLIEQNRVEKDKDGVAYRFNVSGTIHRVFVARETLERISSGALGIVGCPWREDLFEVVPKPILEKISLIDSTIFVNLVAEKTSEEADSDDPYAEYKVPDDLMW